MFYIGSTALFIRTDQLLALFESDGSNRLEEINQFDGVASVSKVKVNTIWLFFYIDAMEMGVVFENELF